MKMIQQTDHEEEYFVCVCVCVCGCVCVCVCVCVKSAKFIALGTSTFLLCLSLKRVTQNAS